MKKSYAHELEAANADAEWTAGDSWRKPYLLLFWARSATCVTSVESPAYSCRVTWHWQCVTVACVTRHSSLRQCSARGGHWHASGGLGGARPPTGPPGSYSHRDQFGRGGGVRALLAQLSKCDYLVLLSTRLRGRAF